MDNRSAYLDKIAEDILSDQDSDYNLKNRKAELKDVLEHAMTVGQLIERLKKYDPDFVVSLDFVAIKEGNVSYEKSVFLLDEVVAVAGEAKYVGLEGVEPKDFQKYKNEYLKKDKGSTK